MTGIILAGGKNSRMGVNKAFLKFGETTIIDNILSIYEKLFREIIIVTNTPEEYEYTGVKLVKDIIPNSGPLGGIYTGILNSHYEYSFVTACDMPFINKDIIRYITKVQGFDIVVPVICGHYEPLFAMYSRKCIPILREQLELENLCIKGVFKRCFIEEVNVEDIWKTNSVLNSFTNVNTPEDFIKALNSK